MKAVVFYGSPRKGNTYTAAKIFMDEMSQCGEVSYSEFFLPKDVPEFCLGCQLCLGNPREKCPHASYIDPIYKAIMEADALIFTTPHYGGSSMTGSMKNLLDHLDFFTLTVSPRKEMFGKKAFVLTTGTGSTSAVKQIEKCLKGWGINRVSSAGIKMFTNKWDKMPIKKQKSLEKRLVKAARNFYSMKKKNTLCVVCFYVLYKQVCYQKIYGRGKLSV